MVTALVRTALRTLQNEIRFLGKESVRHTIAIPLIGDGIIFTGVGDLFAATFLANSTLKASLKEALELTIATLQAVLKNTVNAIPIGE